MEQKKLQPIDLKVLIALYKKAYLPKTADKISKNLNIDYTDTLKIFNKLEKKGLCDQWVVNKKKEKETKNNYYKVCCINKLGKDLCVYINALNSNKPTKKD
ncbi:helix-turn-helix domain-containing protein [Helicobacter pylori]|uniref:helix-turn-helix domain-containing protein n=1 Tax=Helicobacter pylori TaxID=210 RepID=UPI002929EB99|nr:helix-turn-helix domain-containing protein [Helicobacter pylori]MDU9776774.1 helix-turn-helix domain-containing protein [Helicobacter pylori]